MDKFIVKGGCHLNGEVSISGAKNAALLAISILALSNAELAQKLKEFRVEQTRKVEEADASLQDELAKLN